MNSRDADRKFHEVVDSHGERLFSCAGKTDFPMTYRAFFMFCGKVGHLKNGVFDSFKAENQYAAMVLFRCQIEHHLRFMHLWTRFLVEKTDAPGYDYYNYCGASEAIEYSKAIRAAEAVSGSKVSFDIKSILEQLYPDVASCSASEIEREAERFKFRSLVKQVIGSIPGLSGREDPLLTKLIPEYALLSSYVHGGPFAELSWNECDVVRYEDLSFLMFATTFLYTSGAVGREHQEIVSVTSEMNRVLTEFMRAGET